MASTNDDTPSDPGSSTDTSVGAQVHRPADEPALPHPFSTLLSDLTSTCESKLDKCALSLSGDDLGVFDDGDLTEGLFRSGPAQSGATLNLIREFGRISHELSLGEPKGRSLSQAGKKSVQKPYPVDWIIKRLMFLSYELQTLVAAERLGEISETARLSVLNHFVFGSKHFRCINDPCSLGENAEAFRISRVLVDRVGAASVIALVYAYLAEQIGIRLELVDLKPANFLKWTSAEKSRPHYIDITRSGQVITDDELIETLHTRFAMHSICNANLLEASAFESYLTDSLLDLKRALTPNANPEHLLFIQNALISYQPNYLQYLAERASIHRRLGNFKSAYSDLKRYFAFNEKSQAPVEYVSLFDELAVLLGRV